MDFGISLDPLAVSQRHALYDSDSEEEDECQRPYDDPGATDAGRESSSDFLTGRTLLVGVGSTASVFLRSFVRLNDTPAISLPAEAVAAVGRKGSRIVDDRRGPHEIAAVEFCTAEGDCGWVACVQPKLQRPEYGNRWMEKVFDQGKPSHVVVYVCQSLHEYFSPSPLDEDTLHIVRELWSSSWPHPLGGVALEPPNSVKGETAAILTHCELRGIPCAVQILYTSSSLTETEKALCLLPSLQTTANSPDLPKGLPIRGEKEGESVVRKIQPKKLTDLTTLYT